MNNFPSNNHSSIPNQPDQYHRHQLSFQPVRRKLKSKTQLETFPVSSNQFPQENADCPPFPTNQLPSDAFSKDMLIPDKRNDQRSMTQQLNPLCSYYASSQEYLQHMLQKKSPENYMSYFDPYEKSNNFIKKDSFCSKPSTTADDHCGINDCCDDEGEAYFTNRNNDDNSPKNSNNNPNVIDYAMNSQTPININMNMPMNMNMNMNMPIGNNNYNQMNNVNRSPSLINCNNSTPNNNHSHNHMNYFNNDQCSVEMFGKMGWICSLCNNFNYENRFKCNRCKNDKNALIIRPNIPLSPNSNTNTNMNINKELQQQQQQQQCVMMNYLNNPITININNITPNSMNSMSNMTSNNPCKNNNNSVHFINNQRVFNQLNTNNDYHRNLDFPYDPEEDQGTIDYPYSNNSNSNTNINCINSNDYTNSNNIKKRPFKERIGDWFCSQCKNLNFSFRNACNRCQFPKSD